MRNTIETNLDITAGILRKIYDVNPDEKQAILQRHEKNWRVQEEQKNTLKAIFTSNAFWQGVKDGFTAPLFFLNSFLQSKPTKSTAPQILDEANSFDSYARELCKAIHEHLNENPVILKHIHLNDKERALIGLPQRTRIQWADEPSLPVAKPQI